MQKIRFQLLFIFVMLCLVLKAQQPEYRVFYYPGGQKSSEGFLVGNKPDGYWKTYYETGQLKSEGNRKNFVLDSTWRFYDETGQLTLTINYREGKKHGERVSFTGDEVIRELFENDIKSGLTLHFDLKDRLLKSIPFEKGLEEGLGMQYDTLGNIIELTRFKRGYVVERERINRRDAEGRQQGPWKWFYDTGILKAEGNYRNGLRNGIFKEYDRQGNLRKIEKYADDVKQESAEEVARLELRRDYYPGGQVRIEATYRQGVPEGIRREFDTEGNIVRSFTFRNGIMVAEGIIGEDGSRQGYWKEYYPDGAIKSLGSYVNGLRQGDWEFFYPDGKLEQKGSYSDKGFPHGKWLWYYGSGQLLREENYRNGMRDGLLTEYDQLGQVIAQGEFIDDMEEGFWRIKNGSFTEEGEFAAGERTGVWKHFFEDGSLAFVGSFVEGMPNGKHTHFFPNNKKSEEGSFLMGRRNGEWKKWNDDGSLLITIAYVNGIERGYDGINLPDQDIIIVD